MAPELQPTFWKSIPTRLTCFEMPLVLTVHVRTNRHLWEVTDWFCTSPEGFPLLTSNREILIQILKQKT